MVCRNRGAAFPGDSVSFAGITLNRLYGFRRSDLSRGALRQTMVDVMIIR